LRNIVVATNIALGVFYWKSQYLSTNWYYGHQKGVEGGKVKVMHTSTGTKTLYRPYGP
jgi:hypothetical protein